MSRPLFVLFWIVCTATQAQISMTPANTLDAYWNLPTAPGQAQAVLKLSGTAIPTASSSINEVILNQNGSYNTAVLSILSGSQNRLEANQGSNQNIAEGTLSGINNSVLLNQMGGGNSLSIGLTGNNNLFSLTQDGGDRIQMRGLQQNNTRLELNQGSGNNSFTVDNTSLFKNVMGTGIPNLRIEQTGGATAIIQNGRITGN